MTGRRIGGERGADTHAPRFAQGHVGPWGPYAPRGSAMRCRPSTWVELWGSLPRGRRRALLLVLAACVTSPSSRAPAGPGGPKDGLTTAQFVLRNDYTAAALRQKEALAKQRGSDWFSASS